MRSPRSATESATGGRASRTDVGEPSVASRNPRSSSYWASGASRCCTRHPSDRSGTANGCGIGTSRPLPTAAGYLSGSCCETGNRGSRSVDGYFTKRRYVQADAEVNDIRLADVPTMIAVWSIIKDRPHRNHITYTPSAGPSGRSASRLAFTAPPCRHGPTSRARRRCLQTEGARH